MQDDDNSESCGNDDCEFGCAIIVVILMILLMVIIVIV
jgi:hypothetical protein